MSLTLYWNLGSQPARAVKCLLDLGNIKCNFVIMDIMKSQTRTKEYLTLNPLGQIPFLVDGNFKLAESNAILIYLCEKYPDQLAKYYGNTLQQRAIVNQHLSWYQNSFRPSLFKIIVLKIYGGFKQQKPVYASEIHSAEKEMMDSIQQF
jgi:glutathione S-transferase